VVLIGILLKDVVNQGAVTADLSNQKLQGIAAEIDTILGLPETRSFLRSFPSLQFRYVSQHAQRASEKEEVEEDDEEEADRGVHCARPGDAKLFSEKLKTRGLRDLDCTLARKKEDVGGIGGGGGGAGIGGGGGGAGAGFLLPKAACALDKKASTNWFSSQAVSRSKH